MTATPCTVADVRKLKLRGKSAAAVALLLDQLDQARETAAGYASVAIDTGACFAEECDDIQQWAKEIEERDGCIDLKSVWAEFSRVRAERWQDEDEDSCDDGDDDE